MIARGDVQIEGDAQIAQQFRELGLLLRPDLEAGMSQAARPQRRARGACAACGLLRDWARATAWTAIRNVAEYLAHERGDLVSRTEAEHFLRGVDRLREQLDRLEARLQDLEIRERARGRRPGTGLMRLRVVARLIQIQRVLVRHRLDDFVRATHLYRPLRFVFLISPWTWFQRRSRCSRGARLRLALEELGPIFVKFGQALSTRRDLLPADIADELAKLQDKVPPFPGRRARDDRAALRRAARDPPAATSRRRRWRPHRSRRCTPRSLPDGREVIVKVLRPGMKEMIELDLEVLYTIAGMADRWWAESRRLKPIEIVREYEKTMLDELDLMREAANASQLKRNFAGSHLLYVPEIYWDHCRKDVLVMERIRGVPIGDLARLRELGTDFKRLAENGVEIFFTQVFRHNFFHADMHPGNIFVLMDDPTQPRYAAVDFGIVGTLDLRDQRYLAENFLAVFDRDYRRVATLHVQSGWVPAQHACR